MAPAGRKDSRDSSSSDSEHSLSSSDSSDSSRSRSRDRKRNSKRPKSYRHTESDRKKSYKRNRSRSRSRSRENKRRRRRSRSSRRDRKRSRTRSSSRRRRRSSYKSSSRRSRRRRSSARRKKSSRDGRRSRSRRRSSSASSSKIRSPSPKATNGHSDVNTLKELDSKPKTEIENPSPRKKKPTLADFFGDSDEEIEPKAPPTILTGIKFNGLNGSTNGDAKWRVVSPKKAPISVKTEIHGGFESGSFIKPPLDAPLPDDQSSAKDHPPLSIDQPLPAEPSPPVEPPLPVPVPQQVEKPPSSPLPVADVKQEHAMNNPKAKPQQKPLMQPITSPFVVKTECPEIQEILSDGMDISDSDEYDEDDVNFINNSVSWFKGLDNMECLGDKRLDAPISIKAEPVIAVPCPPPAPLRRKSRFSAAPDFDITAPTIVIPKLEPSEDGQKLNGHSQSDSTTEQHEEKPDTDEKKPAMPEFDMITEPIYRCNKDFVRAGKDTRKMDCECRPPDDPDEVCCGYECLNRAILVECSSRCRTGDRCTNKNFQRQNNAPVEVFSTEGKGHGLRATEVISAGTFIMEYVGEVVSAKEFKKRSHEYARSGTQHHYFMELTPQATIDAYKRGSISRFMNHSCEPNAETQKWTVNGMLRIGFFATKDIQPNTEITFNYQFIHFGKAQKCLCGAPSCRGTIGREADEAEYRRKAGVDENHYGKKIMKMKKLQHKEDISPFITTMSRVRPNEIEARRWALELVGKSPRKIKMAFIYNYGLEMLLTYAKDDNVDDNALKGDILWLLEELDIAHRDKVEDNEWIKMMDKWSKTEDEHQERANALVTKWRKLTRMIQLKKIPVARKPSSETIPEPQKKEEKREPSYQRRRSPKPRKPDVDPVEWEKRKSDYRRRFEEKVKMEEEVRAAAEQERLNSERIESSNGSGEYYDMGSNEGPITPPESPNPADMTADEQRCKIKKLHAHIKPSEDDETIIDGVACLLDKHEDGSLLVRINTDDVEEFFRTWKAGKMFEKREAQKAREKAKRKAKEAEEIEMERRMAERMKAKAVKEAEEKKKRVPDSLLPDGWKGHDSEDGTPYYYHEDTRETTWDAPEMSPEEHRMKIEKLRVRTADNLCKSLQEYTDPNCTVGRIENEDDYRYIIKKCALSIAKRIVKELKTYEFEDEAIKLTSRYIRKFMSRSGEVFDRHFRPPPRQQPRPAANGQRIVQ